MKTKSLYYIEAYSRLSEKRERISGYCNSTELLKVMIGCLVTKKPKERIYLRPSIKCTNLNKIKCG